jgi:hypothetical protein
MEAMREQFIKGISFQDHVLVSSTSSFDRRQLLTFVYDKKTGGLLDLKNKN